MSQAVKTPGTASARTAVWLVTCREIAARVGTRSFVVGTLVNIGVILGLLFAFGSPDGEDPPVIVVAGAPVAAFATGAPSSGAPRWENASDAADARRKVTDKDADAALVTDGDHTQLVLRHNTPSAARDAAAAAAERWATSRALQRQNVDEGRMRGLVAEALPAAELVGDPVPGGAGLGAALGVVTILFFQLFGYGMTVAQGVVEEKSTRVVEVLLATLTPFRLMTGKVLGIGAAALLQTALFGASVIVAVRFGHVLPATFPATVTMAAAVAWFVLGFAFFAFLFAAAGSLVSRAEEVSGAVMPVLMATMVPYGVAVAAAMDLTAPWVGVVQYVPPFSMLIMPLQVSAHAAGWTENLAAAALMVVAAAGLAVGAARVYERSILRMGSAIRWRVALRGHREPVAD
ncbi:MULTISPECIES: ABC transporter permease [unclassified Streptomyces]|uniref:ABC transporter permease n=1 Tax=unclassified Streptomyces TaxID=2593676 RepID=UPI002E103818|nr:ABC transporter permease [Streptomyces sp. NBC_01205]